MAEFDLNKSFGFVLYETARLLAKRFDQRAKALGLTRAQTQLLAYLVTNEGINQAGLAEMLEIEPISLARLIDRMEQAGWVERRPDPKDRRAWLLFVTEKVKPIFAKMIEVGQVVRAEALSGLSAAERTQILDMLLRVRRNLSDKSGDLARPMVGAAE
jgi:MarR family transcriptional regulator, transcriptional regulator for hemolysin